MQQQRVSSPTMIFENELNELRKLRVELLDLQTVLHGVSVGDVSITNYKNYINKTKTDIVGLLSQIVFSQGDDAMYRLHNIWEQMQECPIFADPSIQISVQDMTHQLNVLDGQIRKLIFQIGYLTIPARLRLWLDQARPGYYIPFHMVFEDELPNFEDRQTLLNFLIYQPNSLPGGLIDAENGLIYRYSKTRKNQFLSFVYLITAFALAGGIVTGANYIQLEGWPLGPKNLSTLLLGWAAVWAGVIVHTVISATKYSQRQNGRPLIISLGDIPLVIDAKLGQIVFKILLSLVALFGLAFGMGVINVSPLNSFLVGYSLDSVVEVFGTSIERKAAAQVEALRQQLGIEAKS